MGWCLAGMVTNDISGVKRKKCMFYTNTIMIGLVCNLNNLGSMLSQYRQAYFCIIKRSMAYTGLDRQENCQDGIFS